MGFEIVYREPFISESWVAEIKEQLNKIIRESSESTALEASSPGEEETARIEKVKQAFDSRTKNDDKTEDSLSINWSQYDIPAHFLNNLIQKNPAAMEDLYHLIVEGEVSAFKKAKEAEETLKIARLKKIFGNDRLLQPLNKFKRAIETMEALRRQQNNHPSDSADPTDKFPRELIYAFNTLYNKIEDEMAAHSPCKINQTVFPEVLAFHTKLAQEINAGKVFGQEELEKIYTDFDKKITRKKPISPALKMAMCGVIGAIVGIVIGFAVGAAVTFWSGSFGALPAAIKGGLLGLKIGQAYAIGGAALGGGALLSAITGTCGFFSGRKNNHTFDVREKDKKALRKDVIAVKHALPR